MIDYTSFSPTRIIIEFIGEKRSSISYLDFAASREMITAVSRLPEPVPKHAQMRVLTVLTVTCTCSIPLQINNLETVQILLIERVIN